MLNFCNVLSQSNFSKNNLILISAFSPGPVEVLDVKHKLSVSEKCLDAAYMQIEVNKGKHAIYGFEDILS